MKRKTWTAAGVLALVLLLAGVWMLDIPNWKQLDPALLEHLQSASAVYDRNGNEVFTLYGAQKRRIVALEDVPLYVSQAFVAAEDQRFYRHNGIDVRRILGAAWSNLRSGSLGQGASTITQQLIKLTHLSPEKTYRRKIQEAYLAMQAERVYTKDEILEMYINTVYFGSGAYGIDMASEVYFGKRAAELSLSEAALLAGLIKSPNSYAPHISMEKALQRRDYVLDQMEECGYIDHAQRKAAKQETIVLSKTVETGITGWYRDAVISQAARLLNISVEQLLGGAYRIYTALDMRMQQQADACMADDAAFPANGVQGALIAVDPSDGGVLVICGGRSDDARMALNRALESRRQPGSVIKPVSVYAAAIDSGGCLPSDFVDDTQRVFEGGYMPRNAGDRYNGEVTLRTALSKSLNVATVSLAERVGVPAMRNYARRFGIPVENDDASLALALGSMTYGVTPAEAAGAYTALANGGLAVDVHLITKITDRSGSIVYQHTSQPQRAVSRETAAMLTDMLVTAVHEGSGHALKDVGIPVACKTGTVSQDGGTRDAWTVAYTPEVCVAVWMGYDSADQGVMDEAVSGSSYPARMAAAWLSGVSEQLQGLEFSLPDTVERVALDAVVLNEEHRPLQAGEHTPPDEIVHEVFPATMLPLAVSDRYASPTAVDQAQIGTNALGYPVIHFRAAQNGMEYMILRHQNGQIRCLATLTGAADEALSYTDEDVSLRSEADYQIVVRQSELYGKGTLLIGHSEALLHYEPLMARLQTESEEQLPVDDPADATAPLFAP